VLNSTLSTNSAGNDGGGIFNNGGTITVQNCTLAGNFASNKGGGIFNDGVVTVLDSTTCCSNVAGRPATLTNPALPGEIIVTYANGLGLPVLSDAGGCQVTVKGLELASSP